MFDERMPVGIELEATHVDEAPLGIAADRMFDLDDVGTPVGENGPRGRDERELCDFQNPDALHDLDQRGP